MAGRVVLIALQASVYLGVSASLQSAQLGVSASHQSGQIEDQPFYNLVYAEKYPPTIGHETGIPSPSSLRGRSDMSLTKAGAEALEAVELNLLEGGQKRLPQPSYTLFKQHQQQQQQQGSSQLSPIYVPGGNSTGLSQEFNSGLATVYTEPYDQSFFRLPSYTLSPPTMVTWTSLDQKTLIIPKHVMDTLRNTGEALIEFVDVPLIRDLVDLYFDGLSPRGRLDLDAVAPKSVENDGLRRFVATLAGGLLGKQQCWERMLCKLGELLGEFGGRQLIFSVVDRTLPRDWTTLRTNLKIVEDGSRDKETCRPLLCEDTRQP